MRKTENSVMLGDVWRHHHDEEWYLLFVPGGRDNCMRGFNLMTGEFYGLLEENAEISNSWFLFTELA